MVENFLLEHFMKKELQKTNQEQLRIEKIPKRKGDKFYVKLSIHLIVGLIKKTLHKNGWILS